MSIMTPPQDYSTLFLDMNSFFASVEQQVRPNFRKKPLAVAPYIGNSGCVIASSYEAKSLGIKTGMRVFEAKKIYPKIEIVESRPALYMIYHKEIKKVIESFTPYFKTLSIDEFSLKLDRRERSEQAAIEIGLNIKKAIKDKVGESLSCSVGISASTFLAKMAGERKKPDGLTVLGLLDLEKFYSTLELRDLTGINFALEARLKNFKIDSPLSFYQKNLWQQKRMLGHLGTCWYFRLRGYEVDSVEVKNKTIGHSHVLPPELRTKEGAKTVLKKLSFKVCYRLRKDGFFAGGVAVYVRFLNNKSFAISKKTTLFFDNKSLLEHLDFMLRNCSWSGAPSLVAVSVFNLKKPRENQLSLFDDKRKLKKIACLFDDINDHFGKDTLIPASLINLSQVAPDRISFGSPNYEILN